jgi:YD repeat-containing protein
VAFAELLTCTYDERSSNTVNNLGFYSGSIIAYEYVTESIGGDNFEQGGIEHRFRISGNEYPTPIINGTMYDAPLTQGSTLHGVETNTRVFKKLGTQFIILNEVANNYSALASNYYNEVNSWKVNIRWVYPVAPSAQAFSGFDVIRTAYKSYWERLDNTVITSYDQNGSNPLTTIKYYYYSNSNHLQVTKIEGYDSEGDLVRSEFKYPSDFTGPIFDDLLSRNIITPVLDQKVFSNGFLKEQTQLTFKYAGINSELLVPDLVKHAVKYNSPENLVQYEQYDYYGNPLQFTSLDGAKNSFIWDYNNEIPVAEVKNALATDIAYTSFEADGKGNWSFNGLKFTDGSGPTGKKVYALATGDVLKSRLNTSLTYIVSYWSKNGAQNINGSPAGTVSGRSVNGWTYYEKKIINPSSGSITISGSGIIDELRLYPEKALMSTYTYTPLVGITSQCDANNRITYYEYDEYQRLIVVRDLDRNVIRKFCYNYAGNAESCNVFYNEPVSLTFTRSNCPYGQAGGQVTYLIPAGTYVSTADQTDANNKAWDDIILNGQAYANALGSCGSATCSPANCSGIDKKCVNNICETGIKVYTDFYEDPRSGDWVCTYHYEWSDGAWSQDYYEISPVSCKDKK